MKKILLFTTMIFLATVLSACSVSFSGSGGTGTDGGVFVSADQGNTWQQRVLIPTTTSKSRNIASLDNYALAMDPSDHKAVYFGSIENGLFYSYDQAGGWQIAEDLGQKTIRNVVVDPSAKCIIYVAINNAIYKTKDCNRNYSQVYFDNDPEVVVNTLAIDHYNSKIVYAGLSNGEILKSYDKGESWQSVGNMEGSVSKIVISPHDSRIVFAATSRDGLFRTYDGGTNWVSLEDVMKEFSNSKKIRDIVLAEADRGVVLVATNYGLLKSTNMGDSWSTIELLTPEKDAIINSLAVSPDDSNQIYYVTNTTFYRSLDGGANWSSKKLPTSRAGWRIIVDYDNTNIIYLGVRKIKD